MIIRLTMKVGFLSAMNSEQPTNTAWFTGVSCLHNNCNSYFIYCIMNVNVNGSVLMIG